MPAAADLGGGGNLGWVVGVEPTTLLELKDLACNQIADSCGLECTHFSGFSDLI